MSFNYAPQVLDRWVVNLIDCSVTLSQEEVLKLGFNFVPAPTKFPLVDTMAAVEEGARKLKDTEAEDLHGRVCGILRWQSYPRTTPPRSRREH